MESSTKNTNILGEDPADEPDSEPYTIFSHSEKYALSLLASFLAFFSSIAVPIYLPALTELEDYFNVTTEKINLTIVTYSIFQGVAPAFWGPLADRFGRRPIYPLCLITYIGANIGLAMAKSYGMLLGFRALQAAGMAAAVAIGAGLVGDITQRKDRGTFMGLFGGITLLGNALGPLIGAGLSSTWNWRSIFWFLVISAACALVLVLLVLPETNRAFVGNASVRPKRLVNTSPAMVALHGKILIPYNTAVATKRGLLSTPKKSSVLRSFELFFNKDVALVLIPSGIHYTVWFIALTVQSTALTKQYNFSITAVGISYLANGLGSILGSIFGGRLMTYIYAKHQEKFKQKWVEENGPDSTPNMFHFDLIKARIIPSFFLSPIMIVGCLIFGWTIQYNVHWIVPIIMTFFISVTGVTFVNVSNVLMVDIFPQESSSASACVNLVRCLLCAVGLAVIDKMNAALGQGGSMTLLSGICALSLGALLIEFNHGLRWNQERIMKNDGKSSLLYL